MKSLGDVRRALQSMKTKSGSTLKRAKDRDATTKQQRRQALAAHTCHIQVDQAK